MVFYQNVSDNKFPQVSRTPLSILTVLNNVVVWMVSTHPPTSKSSRPFSYSSKRTNYNWYNCHFHVTQFFQCPGKVVVLILLFGFLQFYSVVSRDSKIDNFASSLFLLIIIRSGLFTLLEFFTSVLVDGFSLEFEWQQVSSSLQDSSQYSGRSQ